MKKKLTWAELEDMYDKSNVGKLPARYLDANNIVKCLVKWAENHPELITTEEGYFYRKEDDKMGVKIRVKQVVNKDGECCYEVLNFKGVFKENALPKKYLEVSPNFFAWNSEEKIVLHLPTQGIIYIRKGSIFSEEEWEDKIIPAMQEAGTRRMIIRKEIKELRKSWHDEGLFRI